MGSDAGSIVVAIEYADWAAFAADDAKFKAEPEMQALLKSMATRRKVLSDSMYEETK